MRATFISARTRALGSSRKWVQYLETREIRASGDREGRQEIEKFRVPRGFRRQGGRQGNEVRNEISSSSDESEDEIGARNSVDWTRVFFTNLRIALRLDQIAKVPER